MFRKKKDKEDAVAKVYLSCKAQNRGGKMADSEEAVSINNNKEHAGVLTNYSDYEISRKTDLQEAARMTIRGIVYGNVPADAWRYGKKWTPQRYKKHYKQDVTTAA